MSLLPDTFDRRDVFSMFADEEGHLVLVLERQVKRGTARSKHPFPAHFLLERFLKDRLWAWNTVRGVAARLSREVDKWERAGAPVRFTMEAVR